jgi:hypothetical protein
MTIMKRREKEIGIVVAQTQVRPLPRALVVATRRPLLIRPLRSEGERGAAARNGRHEVVAKNEDHPAMGERTENVDDRRPLVVVVVHPQVPLVLVVRRRHPPGRHPRRHQSNHPTKDIKKKVLTQRRIPPMKCLNNNLQAS